MYNWANVAVPSILNFYFILINVDPKVYGY